MARRPTVQQTDPRIAELEASLKALQASVFTLQAEKAQLQQDYDDLMVKYLLLTSNPVPAEAPAPSNVALSDDSINPNAAQNVVVGQLSYDGGNGTQLWEILDNAKFELSSDGAATPNLERSASGSLTAGATEVVTIKVTSGGLSATYTAHVSVDTLPTAITFTPDTTTINDDIAAGTFISLASTTGGLEPHVYTITDDTNYTTDGAQILRSASGSLVAGSDGMTVRVTDANGNTHDEVLTITVQSPAEPPAPDLLSVDLVLAGVTYTYDEADGNDKGDYIDAEAGIRQRCIHVTHASCPIDITFRQETTGDRWEVVFWNIRCFGAANAAAAHVDPYTVTVRRGVDTLATGGINTAEKHYWGSRWRMASEERPVIFTHAQLVAANLIPPLSASEVYGSATLSVTNNTYTNGMDTAGLQVAEPNQGGRPDIGPMTEQQARYLITGAASWLAAMRAQAEAGGGRPCHYRDENTSGPLSLLTYRQAHWEYISQGVAQWVKNAAALRANVMSFTSGGTYVPVDGDILTGATSGARMTLADTSVTSGSLAAGTAAGKFASVTGLSGTFIAGENLNIGANLNVATCSGHPVWQQTCKWQLDNAHDPALYYIPYLLTRDPYYLEGLQYATNQCIGQYKRTTNYLTPYAGTTRAYAWSLRNIFHAAKVTPVSVPAWLLPKSYFTSILAENHTWFSQRYTLNTTSPGTNFFHIATNLTAVAGWQDEFLAITLGWGKLLGFSDWDDDYLWKIQSTLARTNGTSGWPRQFCTPYYHAIASGLPTATTDPNAVPSGGWYANWGQAWESFKAYAPNAGQFKSGDPNTFTDGTHWQQSNSDEYLLETRGSLAFASYLGVSGASACHAFVKSMALIEGVNQINHRWALSAS